jgi:hypothetical protein
MNTIAVINGSPKKQDSASGMLINQIKSLMPTKIQIYQAVKLAEPQNQEWLEQILEADVLLIVTPLYVDSLPAPLIKTLTLIEQAAERVDAGNTRPLPKVYAICNCGFFESEHNRLALTILENFATRAGMIWGYGLGIGGGGFIASLSDMSKGPAANVYAALCTLAQAMQDAIQDGSGREQNKFIIPKIPRFLYKYGGNRGWRQMAKKYGTRKSLRARPHADY